MKFADKLKEMVSTGLSNMGPQIGAELKRLGTQGSMELASALFNGHGFVPYGPGQYTPTPEPGKDAPANDVDRTQDQGREM
jgi:hypothetical protein